MEDFDPVPHLCHFISGLLEVVFHSGFRNLMSTIMRIIKGKNLKTMIWYFNLLETHSEMMIILIQDRGIINDNDSPELQSSGSVWTPNSCEILGSSQSSNSQHIKG